MPKSTHFHKVNDTRNTDTKFRPEDEGIYEEEKQEFQGSEKDKKAEQRPDDESLAGQKDQSRDQGESRES